MIKEVLMGTLVVGVAGLAVGIAVHNRQSKEMMVSWREQMMKANEAAEKEPGDIGVAVVAEETGEDLRKKAKETLDDLKVRLRNASKEQEQLTKNIEISATKGAEDVRKEIYEQNSKEKMEELIKVVNDVIEEKEKEVMTDTAKSIIADGSVEIMTEEEREASVKQFKKDRQAKAKK